jgi:hypothetical protein
MKPTYKQSCQIDPAKIDFSAFERRDLQEEQFTQDELYEAGIVKAKKGLLQKAIGFVREKKHKKLWLIFIVVAVALIVVSFVLSASFGDSGLMMLLLPLTVAAQVIFPVAIIVLALYVLGWVEEAGRKIQLKWLLFAKQNGFRYHVGSTGGNNLGAFGFGIGYGGLVTNTLELDERLGVAEYTYKTKSGDEEVTHHFNFARFRLGKSVPHLVLDSKFSALQIKGERELKLEGNFQDHFTLYIPEGFHIDALQIFTPDVMSKLLDQEGKYDLELIGDDLYIYEMRRGLIESGLTTEALVDAVKDRERHSQFLNFLSSVINIVSEIDEQTNRYINTHVVKN